MRLRRMAARTPPMLTVDIRKALPEFSLEVSFSVDRGILAILGRSGSGKTMTLRCIAGLMKPDQGRIALDDRVLFDADRGVDVRPQKRRTGFVFQNYALFPNMTVYENIAFGTGGRPKAAVDQHVQDLMERLRISGLGRRYPQELSGGQQQRVALARALAASPGMLLLDEPFSALDVITRDCLQRLLLDIDQFYSGYVLLVTHSLAEAYRLGSRIAVYEAGKVLQIGSRREVMSAPASAAVASMMGVRNLWNAVVMERSGDGRLLLEVQDTGLRVHAACSPAGMPPVGQPVCIGVRPEEMRLSDVSVVDSFPGTVSRVIEEVTSWTIFFEPDAPGTRMRIQVTTAKNGTPPAVGHRCWLQTPEENLMVMPAQR